MRSSYNKDSPFQAIVKEGYSLCPPESHKNTLHFSLDISNSKIQYEVGDSIAILPQNSSQLVDLTIKALQFNGNEPVTDRNGEDFSLRDFLTKKANITSLNNKIIQTTLEKQENHEKSSSIQKLLEKERSDLREYFGQHSLYDFLVNHQEVKWSPQELCNLLSPMLPRFYSVASSQKVFPNEVHLTVAHVQYTNSSGQQRHGLCSNYLLSSISSSRPISIYVQPHKGFTIPEDHSKDIIMVGPGTGLAPFRAFMQERLHLNAQGKNWLFFGECNHSQHYFYEKEWKEQIDQGKLQMDVAFSRDQEEKVYVQDRMKEKAADIYRWIEGGALLYICGDANQMAKAVEQTLLGIFEEQGKITSKQAKELLKTLRKEKRYLRDIY